jgi:hypothetical protein
VWACHTWSQLVSSKRRSFYFFRLSSPHPTPPIARLCRKNKKKSRNMRTRERKNERTGAPPLSSLKYGCGKGRQEE